MRVIFKAYADDSWDRSRIARPIMLPGGISTPAGLGALLRLAGGVAVVEVRLVLVDGADVVPGDGGRDFRLVAGGVGVLEVDRPRLVDYVDAVAEVVVAGENILVRAVVSGGGRDADLLEGSVAGMDVVGGAAGDGVTVLPGGHAAGEVVAVEVVGAVLDVRVKARQVVVVAGEGGPYLRVVDARTCCVGRSSVLG